MSEVFVRTPQPPLQRTRRQGKLARSLLDLDSVFAENTAIYFALDASTSMQFDASGNNNFSDAPEDSCWYAQITGVINLLQEIRDRLESGAEAATFVTEDGVDFLSTEDGVNLQTEQTFAVREHSLSINFFPNRDEQYPELEPEWSAEGAAASFPPFERFNLSPIEFNDAIAHLEAIQTPDGGFGYPSPYDQGVEAAPDFFDTATQSNRVVFLFADGGALPDTTAQAAADILAPYGADVYYYRFLSDEGDGDAIDNTPEDGLPVLSSLDALSWGVWNAVLTPPSYIVPGVQGEPDQTRTTAVLVMRMRITNVSPTTQTAVLRYRNLVSGDTFHLYRADIAVGEQVSVPIAGDIINYGFLLEARTSLGGEIRVSVDYVEILQEVIA